MERALQTRAAQLEQLAEVAVELSKLAQTITGLRRLAYDDAKLRVLLVQKDPMLRASLRQALQNQRHRVVEANDFADALVLLATDAFDAVVADEQLGSAGSGSMLLAEVRNRWPFVRRVLCAASAPQLAVSLDPEIVQRLLALPVEETLLLASLL
jgi:DNA-binding NtrC family response regulator